jgi:hypothetical protein
MVRLGLVFGGNSMRMSVVLAIGALLGLPAPAAAQDASCLCTVSLDSRGPVASLDDVDGRVLLSASHGYAQAGPGAGLGAGDRLVLMTDARAVLSAGDNCRVRLAAPSLVSVVARQSDACITEDTLDVAVEPAQGPPVAGGQPPGLARLSSSGFFTDLGAFLGTRGVGDGVPARTLEEVLPVSP